MKKSKSTIVFDPKTSIQRAQTVMVKKTPSKWSIVLSGKKYSWNSRMERVALIRQGLPYESIDLVSKRINVSVKQVLHIFDIPQTTYNKKRREDSLLSGRISETVLDLTELIDFGIETFNNDEAKFQRWLKKNNLALGGVSPESLLDSLTGIQEVKNCLSRLEYGNVA